MATKTVGELIKEARTGAGMTQIGLAKAVGTLTSAEVGKAERGEKELTKDQLKGIAKATGVTQKSLLDAPFSLFGLGSSGSSGSGSSGSGLTLNTASSTGSGSTSSVKLSADEKKLIEAYRKADDKTKKTVIEALGLAEDNGGSALGGIASGLLGNLIGGGNQSSSNQSGGGNLLGAVLGGALGGGQSSQNSQSSQGGGGLMGTLLSAVGLREGEEMPSDAEPVIYEVGKEEPKAEEKPAAKKPAAKKPVQKRTPKKPSDQ